MKLHLLPKVLLAGVFASLLTPAVWADSDKRNDKRPVRFDTKVSNDSDRNRNVRNERTEAYKRQQDRRNDSRQVYYRSGHRYYGGGGYYGYGYPYSYGYYPRTSIAIGVGTGYYDTEYVGTVNRDDDRPIYRGQQLSETSNSSLEVAVQKKLARLGYYKGSLDGDIGPASRRAISRYQRDNDLAETGRIDRNLVNSLGLS